MEIKPVNIGDWGGLRATLQTSTIDNFRRRLKQITPSEVKWWCERAGLEWQDSRTGIRTAGSLSYSELDKLMRTQQQVERMSNRLKTGVVI
ncbi:hypothetical protein [Testudinibacter aquarius]|uniref:Uncharacterized protein n=1 Tax=Testudinibacter aquarius TaxID=1524974 RepID=A0A4R3YA57_9PAST|nr:hypothetical protein [Testudinibacter aquarius]KAE9526040.1 hypothetical protein A1D24_03140 [Testudinibacter aquarius]TCV87233.1 hypothetical protein EDC16_105152 [Testudinibacter aquarius]TNG91275.1 hypothetical protein FHQ21_08220 [Testudinibacter aquarius]